MNPGFNMALAALVAGSVFVTDAVSPSGPRRRAPPAAWAAPPSAPRPAPRPVPPPASPARRLRPR